MKRFQRRRAARVCTQSSAHATTLPPPGFSSCCQRRNRVGGQAASACRRMTSSTRPGSADTDGTLAAISPGAFGSPSNRTCPRFSIASRLRPIPPRSSGLTWWRSARRNTWSDYHVELSGFVLAAVGVGGVLVMWGVTVGLFYAHVAECNRFRIDIVNRLVRIESKVEHEYRGND